MAEDWAKVGPEIARALGDAPRAARKRYEAAAKAGEEEARRLAPVDTGRLRASIEGRVVRKQIRVSFPERYAAIEFGSARRGISAHNFAGRGIEKAQDEAEKLLDDIAAAVLGGRVL